MTEKIKIKDNEIIITKSILGKTFEIPIKIKNNIIFSNSTFNKLPEYKVVDFIKENLSKILQNEIQLDENLHFSDRNSNRILYVYSSSAVTHRFNIMVDYICYYFELYITEDGEICIKDLSRDSNTINSIKYELDKIKNSYTDKNYKQILIKLINEIL